MVPPMKTTVEISGALLEAARKVAATEGTTLRELIEAGLRQTLADRKKPGEFKLRKASFRGKGLQTPLKGVSWDRLREMAYVGRFPALSVINPLTEKISGMAFES